MSNDERYYNIKKLNVVFAVSALALLGAVGFLFIKDYSREWKKYQAEFNALEVEKARVKYDKASSDLSQQEEYKALLTKLDDERKRIATACADKELQKNIKDSRSKNDILQQQYKFRKAELDAVKYVYEEAKHKNSENLAQATENLNRLETQTADLKAQSEGSQAALDSAEAKQKECAQSLASLEQERRKTAAELDIVERKLKNIDPQEMTVGNQIAAKVRDLPIIDLANPKLKIEQIVLNDLRDDVNFITVPKVERCITCHLGITNPDYKDAAQPFRTHPNLELYVGKDSAHPIEEFGCTTCHGGRARGTSFDGAAHTPSSEEQKKLWEEKYDWKKIHLWEEPMLPTKYVEASCFKCHSGETAIKGAEKLNLGLHLIEKAGCYGCHTIDKYKDWPKPGPNLNHLASKFSKEWAYKWIADPHSFRHNTWMPAFFNQSNNNDPASLARTQQEIHAMVHYLYAKNTDFSLEKVPFTGDKAKGEELVSSMGCFACHQVQKKPEDTATTRDSLRRQHGFNLIGLGSKTSPEWIFNWLKDPKRYHPETKMPNMRLTDQEAADITAYLTEDRNRYFEKLPVPQVSEEVVNQITMDFLTSVQTKAQAEKSLASMNLDDKLLFTGEKLIGHYGCYGCHAISGFENAKPIGAELTFEGEKSIHNLDFGFIHIEHSNYAWFSQKLRNPRIFDDGKLKTPLEKLKMPNFNLKDEEIEAVTTAVLGFVSSDRVKAKIKPRTAENLYIEEGQEIIRQFNCQGCHIIDDEGGSIKPTVTDWLKNFKNTAEPDALKFTDSYSPPNLYGLGKKVRPEWLFNFLHTPSTKIRPWLSARMPSYEFNVTHLNALVRYFNTLDHAVFPFEEAADTTISKEEYAAAEKMFSNEYFDCMKCHVVGDALPSGSAETWAPDLGKVKEKIRPNWLIDWIKDPQKVVPGTKMPTFYDPASYENAGPEDILNGDENEQIRILRNFLMNLTSATPANPTAASGVPLAQ